MRVADKMNFNQVTRSLNDNRGDMSKLTDQAATGKSLLKPSDNPVAAAKVLKARTSLSAVEQFLQSNQEAQNFLNFTEQSLAELTDIYVRAKELALSQANDPSSSPQSMGMVAREVGQLFADALAIGNRRIGDKFLFGGFRTVSEPFDQNGNYYGDSGDILMEVRKGQYLAANLPGSKVFLGEDYQATPVDGTSPIESNPIELYDGDSKNPTPVLRGPASVNNIEILHPEHEQENRPVSDKEREEANFARGTNILDVLKSFQISLEAGDKRGVQQAIEDLEIARSQVVTLRSQIGSRMNTVEKNLESLEKLKLDNRVIVSQQEDADAFKVYSELKRSEGNLQATLQTSGRLIQPSLLDFLS
tara:strand:- start:2335 stop:3417 length:1083 start_codon:yes stop_codon:yes gene_type:complete